MLPLGLVIELLVFVSELEGIWIVNVLRGVILAKWSDNNSGSDKSEAVRLGVPEADVLFFIFNNKYTRM